MRTVSSAFTNARDNVRVVGARAIVRDTLPRFSTTTISESELPSLGQSEYNGGILKITYSILNNHLFYQYVYNPSTYANTGWVDSGITVYEKSSPRPYENRVYYQDASGSFQYADFSYTNPSTHNIGSPTSLAHTYSSPCAIVGLSDKTIAYCQCNGEVALFNFLGYDNIGGTWLASTRYPGLVPMPDEDGCKYFDAVQADDGVYYYFNGGLSCNHGMYLFGRLREDTKTAINTWGVHQQMIRFDVSDSDNYYKFMGVNVIDGEPYITGVLNTESYDNPLIVYMRGPKSMSMGRELFIYSTDQYRPGGKLFLFNDELIYSGIKQWCKADATIYFGYDNSSLKQTITDIHRCDVEWEDSQRAMLVLSTTQNIDRDIVRPGSELQLDISYDDNYQTVQKFIIESVKRNENKSIVIQAGSYNIQRMATWQPEFPIDYIGTKADYCRATDGSQLVNNYGRWQSVTNGLKLTRESGNGLGLLRAATLYKSRNMSAKARFYLDEVSDNRQYPRFGILLKHQWVEPESREGAYWLNGQRGFGATIEWDDGNSVWRAGLYQMEGGTFTLAQATQMITSITIPNPGWITIEAQIIDNYVTMSISLEDGSDSFHELGLAPSFGDIEDYGYVGAFIQKFAAEGEDYYNTFTFNPQSVYLPVDTYDAEVDSKFSVGDQVQVDNEIMTIEEICGFGKDWNYTGYSNMEYHPGGVGPDLQPGRGSPCQAFNVVWPGIEPVPIFVEDGQAWANSDQHPLYTHVSGRIVTFISVYDPAGYAEKDKFNDLIVHDKTSGHTFKVIAYDWSAPETWNYYYIEGWDFYNDPFPEPWFDPSTGYWEDDIRAFYGIDGASTSSDHWFSWIVRNENDAVFGLHPGYRVSRPNPVSHNASKVTPPVGYSDSVTIHSVEVVRLDEVYTLEDLMREIVKKSNGNDLVVSKTLEGPQTITHAGGWDLAADLAAYGKTASTVTLKAKDVNGEFGVALRGYEPGTNNIRDLIVTVKKVGVKFCAECNFYVSDGITPTLSRTQNSSYPWFFHENSDVIFQIAENMMFVFVDGRPIAWDYLWDTPIEKPFSSFLVANSIGSADVDWSDLDARVESHYVREGADGLSSMRDLLMNSVTHFRDTQNNYLYAFKDSEDVNTELTPFDMVFEAGHKETYAGYSNRIHVISLEEVEVLDMDEIIEHGDFYQNYNDDRFDFIVDMYTELDRMLERDKRAVKQYSFQGPIDLRPEIYDKIYAKVVDRSGDESIKHLLIKHISMSVMINNEEVIGDMRITAEEL
jgi:hypothetical protein